MTLLAAVVAGGLTDLVIFVPSLHYAYRSAPIHVMLETAATLIALLTTFLLWGRLRQRQRLNDLLLFVALGLLSLTNLLFAAVPAVRWAHPHSFSMWTTLMAGAVGAALLAGASLMPGRRLANYERAAKRSVLVGVATLLAIGSVVGASVDRLPSGIDPADATELGHWPAIGSGAIVVVQVIIAGLFAIAAYGFTRRAERDKDELLLWLGAGSAVAAFARVNYFAFPSLYSEWVYTGDALRLCFYILLFVGAVREIQIYQRAFAESEVLEERRRIARDLHDGLAQELSYITNRARELAADAGAHTQFLQLASAAQRALDESRRAIVALTAKSDEPFDRMLIQAVEEVAQRLGTRIEIEAEPAPEIAPYEQEQLLRIVREAVTNAGRHANADLVRVKFTNGGPLRLRIEDDGGGFDPAHVDATGFGLVTMRERAAAIGGECRITSRAGRGTLVEVQV